MGLALPLVNFDLNLSLKVSDLMLESLRRWNMQLISSLFTSNIVQSIFPRSNRLINLSGRLILKGGTQLNPFYLSIIKKDFLKIVHFSLWHLCEILWKSKIQLKIFFWRLANSILPWYSTEDETYPLCNTNFDTDCHLFGNYLFYRVIWSEL